VTESGWTVETLKEHFDALLAEIDARYEMRYELARGAVEQAARLTQVAVDKAENATERRFESVNEFRQQLLDQTRTLP
jgi:hypothetical protein